MTTVDSTNLNLTRKWRSKNFDQIVGQDVSVKILKNSLYLGQFFPVYLFSGQRGCGKTSMARIFAAALNCQALESFQKNPKSSIVPCLECPSCQAMAAGKHPDFFEIDAASHTGVDTIRHIIDSSQLLPLMGNKKIYLIDEAHMLSKASCNALLKILEEPPRSVLFMLATTDPQKIIETVRSRCFQLLFKPIEKPLLLEHLIHMCMQEQINYETSGLELIIQETDGSARDAINLLEQVRFSASVVNKKAVLQVLGHCDDGHVIAMIDAIVQRTPAHVLTQLQDNNFESYSAEFMWERIIMLLRALIWRKHGVASPHFAHYAHDIERIAAQCSMTHLHDMLDHLYAQEAVFMRTPSKHTLLEMILVQLCQRHSKKNKNDDSPTGTPLPFQQEEPVAAVAFDEEGIEQEHESDDEDSSDEAPSAAVWSQFVHAVQRLDDPLLSSVFKQGHLQAHDVASGRIDVIFPQKLSFFKDWLQETQHVWQPLLTTCFGPSATLQAHFNQYEQASAKASAEVPLMQVKTVMQEVPRKVPTGPEVSDTGRVEQRQAKPAFMPRNFQQRAPRLNEQRCDVSDVHKWPQANLLLTYFPGVITQVKEMRNG
jgi:DNA polymerase-3 subunit gamma/tau